MENLINISDEVSSRLDINKEKYPNIRDFVYNPETDVLSYNGDSIKRAGYGINRIAPIFFQMIPQDIFDYLKGGYYYQSSSELEKVNSMLNQEMIITEDEEAFLKKFANDSRRRLEMYANNKFLFDSNPNNPDLEAFLIDLKARKEIMDSLNNNMSVAATIIKDTSSNNNLEEEQTQSKLEKTMTLTRKNPNHLNYRFREQEEIDAENKLGLAGFSNIVLILVSAITLGMFIALVTLGA